MAVQIATSLIKNTKAAKVLNGMLLPKPSNDSNSFLQLNDVYTCLIVDNEESEAVALAAVLRYSRTQAYCCLSEINKHFTDKSIRVEPISSKKDIERDDGPISMQLESGRVIKSKDIPKYKKSQPLYMIHKKSKTRPALDQVLDACVGQALGLKACEHKKNVTVDLGIDVVLKVWRDRLGFVVVDSREFVELCLDSNDLKKLVSKQDPLSVRVCNDIDIITEYDRSVCRRQSRSEYLNFLCHISGMQCLTVTDAEKAVVGIGMVYKDMILFLYADTDTATDTLMEYICTNVIHKQNITFTTVKSERLDLLTKNVPRTEKLIRRYHTTSPPKEVDWSKVSIINCGMHIV